jgi:hypothetical protein
MGYYFWRVTGSPFHTPFFVNIETYNPVPYFPWQAVKALPVYLHAEIRNFYLGWWMPIYELARRHPGVALLLKFWTFAMFYLGPLFSFLLFVALLTIPYGASFHDFSRRNRFMLLVGGSVIIGVSLPVIFSAHYAAPIACVLYVVLLIAMQRLRRWKPFGRPSGLAVVRYVPTIAVMMLLLRIVVSGNGTDTSTNFPTWCSPAVYRTWRSEIRNRLLSEPGNHVVIVRYRPNHPPINEWVFNDADIDHSKIVWARDMGPERNRELINYFNGRDIQLVEPDENPVRLSAYNEASGLQTIW